MKKEPYLSHLKKNKKNIVIDQKNLKEHIEGVSQKAKDSLKKTNNLVIFRCAGSIYGPCWFAKGWPRVSQV